MNKQVTLKKGKESSLERMHPWIFSGAIATLSEEIESGEVVDVLRHDGQFLAKGHFNEGSLAIKVLSRENEVIDAAWYAERLKQAYQLRQSLSFPSKDTNAYRLVHGEGDRLPGLIVDVYADVVVVQPHSVGMERDIEFIRQGLVQLGYKHIVHKPVDKRAAQVLAGEVSERIEVKENAMRFHVDVLKGQKTGFFIDQRDNRALIQRYAKGKRVLNAFSYSGGFSVAAALAGAVEVHSLDASASALSLAKENAVLNGLVEKHRTIKQDAVKYLSSMTDRYDLIVLDPPAFAKHKSARHQAIQAYKRINLAALEQLEPGGVLFTFSCSQVIDELLFKNTVASAAMAANFHVQLLHRMRQPADHPVHLSHPEGEYLKGLVLRKLG